PAGWRAPLAGPVGRGASAAGVSLTNGGQGPIPQFSVYLFDIDGTLLDSAQDICGAVQQVLDNTPACPPVTYEYLKSFIGRHLIDLFSDVFPHYTTEQIDLLIAEYRRIYLGQGHKRTSVYPGVAEALASL